MPGLSIHPHVLYMDKYGTVEAPLNSTSQQLDAVSSCRNLNLEIESFCVIVVGQQHNQCTVPFFFHVLEIKGKTSCYSQNDASLLPVSCSSSTSSAFGMVEQGFCHGMARASIAIASGKGLQL